MATLNVSDVLDDPDFRQEIELRNYRKTTDGRGETVLDHELAAMIPAVVTPISEQELQRYSDVERLNGGCTVYTRYPLQAGDHIVANGIHFVVIGIDNWQAFGDGFVSATCGRTELNERH